jgi:putative chitinase
LTLADLQAMFPGKIRTASIPIVEAGLPGLLEQMAVAEINTPRRIAAFLTTLAFESRFEYNIHQAGDTRTYAGRGYIQLTGPSNYISAGEYLGVDLTDDPDLALSLEWSAKIARWYWTVARPSCNSYADALRMGKVNAAIGYPRSADGSNDNARCAAFAKALAYLTGGPLEPVDCAR